MWNASDVEPFNTVSAELKYVHDDDKRSRRFIVPPKAHGMSGTDVAYKIFRHSELAALIAEGVFRGSEDDLRDGYIHLSMVDQVSATLLRHFRDKPMLFLGFCAVSTLKDALRMEPSRGGASFPHLYRPLLVTDLEAIVPIPDEREGWHPPILTSAT